MADEVMVAPPEAGQEPMTPDELRAYRKRHGLTRAQVAVLAGVAAGTVRNWEQEGSGRRGMPVPADILLKRATRADIARVKREHPPKHPKALVGDDE